MPVTVESDDELDDLLSIDCHKSIASQSQPESEAHTQKSTPEKEAEDGASSPTGKARKMTGHAKNESGKKAQRSRKKFEEFDDMASDDSDFESSPGKHGAGNRKKRKAPSSTEKPEPKKYKAGDVLCALEGPEAPSMGNDVADMVEPSDFVWATVDFDLTAYVGTAVEEERDLEGMNDAEVATALVEDEEGMGRRSRTRAAATKGGSSSSTSSRARIPVRKLLNVEEIKLNQSGILDTSRLDAHGNLRLVQLFDPKSTVIFANTKHILKFSTSSRKKKSKQWASTTTTQLRRHFKGNKGVKTMIRRAKKCLADSIAAYEERMGVEYGSEDGGGGDRGGGDKADEDDASDSIDSNSTDNATRRLWNRMESFREDDQSLQEEELRAGDRIFYRHPAMSYDRGARRAVVMEVVGTFEEGHKTVVALDNNEGVLFEKGFACQRVETWDESSKAFKALEGTTFRKVETFKLVKSEFSGVKTIQERMREKTQAVTKAANKAAQDILFTKRKGKGGSKGKGRKSRAKKKVKGGGDAGTGDGSAPGVVDVNVTAAPRASDDSDFE